MIINLTPFSFRSERELVEDIVKFVWNKVLEAPHGIESEVLNRDFEAFQATSQAMEKVMMALKDDKSSYSHWGVRKGRRWKDNSSETCWFTSQKG